MNQFFFRPVGCVTLLACVIVCATSGARPGEASLNALSADDIAVIRAILLSDSGSGYGWKALNEREGRQGCLVLADRTVPPVVKETEREEGRVVFEQPDRFSVPSTAIDALLARNQNSVPLADLTLPPPFLLEDSGIVDSIIDGAVEENSWAPTSLLCGDCVGMIHVSLPGYSSEGTEAVIYVSFTGNTLGDLGYLRHLKRTESGRWEPTNEVVTKFPGLDRLTVEISPYASQEEREDILKFHKSTVGRNVPVILEERRGRISERERAALVALYEATQGDHWKKRAGWLGPPGTECGWEGVRCMPADVEQYADEGVVACAQRLNVVTDLSLYENNLAGIIPAALADLTHLKELDLMGNNLTGPLPERLGGLSELEELYIADSGLSGPVPHSILERWDAGRLRLVGYAGQLSPITQIELDVKVTAVICGDYNAVIKCDGSASLTSLLCRNVTPEDRETYVETKTGKVYIGDVDRLVRLLEVENFYQLNGNYSRLITHGSFETVIATRGEERVSVEDYAESAPASFWQIKTAIQGVLFRTRWVKVEALSTTER